MLEADPSASPSAAVVKVEWVPQRSRFLHRETYLVKVTQAPKIRYFTPREWFDICETADTRRPAPGGGFRVEDLHFTGAEWRIFRDGVRAGEYAKPAKVRRWASHRAALSTT